MSKLDELLTTAGEGVTNATVGELGSQIGYGLGELTGYNKALAKKQVSQQQKLTSIQEESNKRLMDESYAHQLQLWEDTNYPAQIEQLTKAGLNPALLYAKGGTGGTTGSGTTSVSGAQASDETSREMTNIATEGMGLSLAKMQSEIEVNKSIANKNNTDASVQGNEGRNNIAAQTELTKQSLAEIQAKITNLQADTTLKGQETELSKLQQNAISIANSFNEENNITMLKENIQILKKLSAEANVSEATQNSLIEQAKQNVKLTISQTLENYKEIDVKKQEILNMIQDNVLNRIDTMSQVTRREYESELQAETINMERQLRDKQINQSEINSILSILGTISGASIFGAINSEKNNTPKKTIIIKRQ